MQSPFINKHLAILPGYMGHHSTTALKVQVNAVELIKNNIHLVGTITTVQSEYSEVRD